MTPTAVPEVDGRDEALVLVRDLGYHRREEPFRLASGQLSHDYVDVKLAIDTGARLRTVCSAMLTLARAVGMDPTHVGGLTMGADPLAHGIVLVDERLGWFSVRKEPKQRGLSRWIEGSRVGPGDRVLLVDDVVTTGGSIQQAYDHVVEAGASVVGAMPVLDRGDLAGLFFTERGVPFQALLTYQDLGIEPVGPAEPAPAP